MVVMKVFQSYCPSFQKCLPFYLCVFICSSYYGIIILFLGKCEDCTTNELIKHFTHPSILNKSQLLWVFVFIDHADTNDEFDQAVRNISQSTFFLHNISTTLRFHETIFLSLLSLKLMVGIFPGVARVLKQEPQATLCPDRGPSLRGQG